jgi:hypothetical protein
VLQAHAPFCKVALSLQVRQVVPVVLEQVAQVLLHIATHSLPDWVKPVEHEQTLGLVVLLVTIAPDTQVVHPVESLHVWQRELQLALQVADVAS